MNIAHITQRLTGCHLPSCACTTGGHCDCGALMANTDAPLEFEPLADIEVDEKGTADGKQ